MSYWIVETTESFNEEGFYVILENQSKHIINSSGFYSLNEYPSYNQLQNLGVDLNNIEYVYEIVVESDENGQEILIEPKDNHNTISIDDSVRNTLFVVNVGGELSANATAKSKGKIAQKDDKGSNG